MRTLFVIDFVLTFKCDYTDGATFLPWRLAQQQEMCTSGLAAKE